MLASRRSPAKMGADDRQKGKERRSQRRSRTQTNGTHKAERSVLYQSRGTGRSLRHCSSGTKSRADFLRRFVDAMIANGERGDRLEWPLEFVAGNPGHINE